MKVFRRTWPYVLLVLLLAANVVAWSQRQNIADWWRLRNYQAPSDITALATDDTMTSPAQHLFFINHPSLESKENFNKHCSDESKETAVLGCYRGNRQGIYIYAVTDARLEGVRQVTAAHEMLHQAYDRLSAADRNHINSLLEDFYNHGLTDTAVKTKLDSYKTQPGTVLVNEMHSIFGTEVRSLPPELESYYKQYFTDRLKVVSFREAYQGEFTRRQDLVRQYDAQLASLKTQISTNRTTLDQEMNFLAAKEKAINQDISSSNQSAYQADVQAYNTTVTAYNALLTTTRSLITQHNDIVNRRNDLAVQEQQLQQALDSRLASPTTKQ
jgi:hypothetical protein